MQRFLEFVEFTGNKLPHPITLFAILAAAVILIFAIASRVSQDSTGSVLSAM
ncbi:AbgT family transporter [Alteribacillus sp. HJP-4]|uniref:AbgT family transporter n=1 Tax=Alteribacillus sp. HJP-4 TaxID=2775394 RepID=UPI0035CD2C83